MNRVEDSITLTAYSGTAGNSTLADSLSIDVADINALPAVAMMVVDEDGDALDPQPTSVAEGTSVMVAVMPVDKDGEAEDADRGTHGRVDADRHGRFGGLHVGRDVHHRMATI